MKKILHISDIHASMHPTKGQSRQNIIRLKEKLIQEGTMLEGIDTIIVSGDLSYSGKKEEFSLFENELLRPVAKHLNLSNERIIITNGNHDVSRENIAFSVKKTIKAIRENYDSVDIEELKNEIRMASKNSSENFLTYARDFYQNSSSLLEFDDFYQTHKIGNVGVACIGTAWSCLGENDRENLFIGEKTIEQALKSIKNFEEKLVVLHHPFDWLHPQERKSLTSQVSKNKVTAVFYGHMHDFQVLRESTFSEDFVMKLQAGRFDLSGKDESGYSIITLDHTNSLKSGFINFRSYNEELKSFKPWSSRYSNGYMAYELNPTRGFNRELFAEDCEKIAEEIEFDLMCNTGVPIQNRKRLTEIFVCPTIRCTSHELEEEGKEKHLSFEEIDNSRENLVIVGGENSGKSTILKKLVHNRIKKQSKLDFDEIAYYLDCRGKSFPSQHRIKSMLCEIYSKSQNSNHYIDALHNKINTQNALLIFDGVESLDKHSIDELVSFLNNTKNARYIISCKHAILQEIATRIRGQINSEFLELNIGSMKRSHLKGIVEKWLTPTSKSSNITKEILRAVENAGMPNNLFVYSMLLSIYERKQGNFSTYLHEADLVENFIEVIMHKHCVTRERAPQYKDLLRLLGTIADEMTKRNKFLLSFTEMDTIILNFNNNIAQDFQISSYLNPILASGVIELSDKEYRFSQACFFDYSYARILSSKKTNYAKLHEQLNFLRFNKAIEYLSAIAKDDVALLDFCRDLTQNSWDKCIISEGLNDLKAAEIELELAAKSDILDTIEYEKIERSLEADPPKETELFEELDNSRPLRAQAHGGEIRGTWDTLHGATLFQSSLSLYARVFRAAEHITERNFADGHFNSALGYYEKTIALNTRKFHETLRPIVISKLIEHSNYKKLDEKQKLKTTENINAFLNFLVSSFPNFTVSMMASDLINSRQITRLKEKRATSNSNLEKIIITYSLCELDETDKLSEIKSLNPQKSFEFSSLIVKLIELSHMDFTISEHARNELLKHARSLLKNKSARKLVSDMSEISAKISEELLESN